MARLDDENEEVSNMLDEADDMEKRRVTALRLGWTKREVGATKCLNPAIDLKATCGCMRVDARPKAKPKAKRLQFRRGCRHLVTLELERATADIVCQWFRGQRTADKVRPASFSSAVSLSRASRPH